MFSALRATFRKFRTFMRAIRAGVWGLVTVLGVWVFFAPPSATEINHLSLSADSTTTHELLRAHRMAKVLMMVGTDRTYNLIASRAGNGLTADDVRLSVAMAAGGRPLLPDDSASSEDLTNDGGTNSGGKFVAARTN